MYTCTVLVHTKSFEEVAKMMWVSGAEESCCLCDTFKATGDETAKLCRLNWLIATVAFSCWSWVHWWIWWGISRQQITAQFHITCTSCCTTKLTSMLIHRNLWNSNLHMTAHLVNFVQYRNQNFIWKQKFRFANKVYQCCWTTLTDYNNSSSREK